MPVRLDSPAGRGLDRAGSQSRERARDIACRERIRHACAFDTHVVTAGFELLS